MFQSADSININGNGDSYVGLDRFGRVKNLLFQKFTVRVTAAKSVPAQCVSAPI